MNIELLSPAKNLPQGIAAINHGADAVYIGAPAFGARQAASNSVADIELLVKHAHTFGARVYVTLNTILFDNEIEPALKLIHNLYNIGIDALIIQDMGLLECNLPPITLHASTQTHNYSPEKIHFLENVGFSRIILAREVSLDSIRNIRQKTSAELEAFVHGALCVSFSGQCYMSQFLSKRSGNRGCCTQPCRSKFDLLNASNKLLRHNEHLLSLRDFNASQHIADMIDAGICSFKIEGRLKDMAYVCNLTAYYRKLIDAILEQKPNYKPLSSGKTSFCFTPDPLRTFSRRYTDYFLEQRQKMASFTTQKSLGKRVAKVTRIDRNKNIVAEIYEPLSPGDGLCAYNPVSGEMSGFLVNHADGNIIVPNSLPILKPGMDLWRNHDIQFERIFKGHSAERKINIDLFFSDFVRRVCINNSNPISLNDTVTDGYCLRAIDTDGCEASVEIQYNKTLTDNPQKSIETVRSQLSKLGGTPFNAVNVCLDGFNPSFIPVSVLNRMRREVVEKLIAVRLQHFAPNHLPVSPNSIAYNCGPTDYRLNITNRLAEQFYRRHGVEKIEYGLETTECYDNIPLMTTKYCLRYEIGQCLKHKCNQNISPDYRTDLFLLNNGHRLMLKFNCERCEMEIFKA